MPGQVLHRGRGKVGDLLVVVRGIDSGRRARLGSRVDRMDRAERIVFGYKVAALAGRTSRTLVVVFGLVIDGRRVGSVARHMHRLLGARSSHRANPVGSRLVDCRMGLDYCGAVGRSGSQVGSRSCLR